jgi:RHS repeat-associated protein
VDVHSDYNQYKTVTDAGTTESFKQGSGDYLYDANGNMIVDPNKGLSDIKYNNLNLPCSITKGANKINYIYDVTGRKLANKLSGKTKYYFGNFVYTDDKLEYMICSEGLLNINGSTTNYEFHLKDHLGNTRVAVNENNNITQENNYYPFGLTFAQSGSSTNKYLYNGKEKQEETEWLAYGWRMYDAQIGRWHVVDPLAEDSKLIGWSPYAYVRNNPMKYVDPFGLKDTTYVKGQDKPITIEPGTDTPIEYERDEKGNIKYDENGKPIITEKSKDAYNCHSYAWHKSEGDKNDENNANEYPKSIGLNKWDNNPADDIIEQNYSQLDNNENNQTGDRVIYYIDKNGDGKYNEGETIEHSAVVSKVSSTGNTIEVKGKMGQSGVSTNHPTASGYYSTQYGTGTKTSRAYFRKK